MAETKKNPPETEEVLESFEATSSLRDRALKPGNGNTAALKAIADAENALELLSVNFGKWMVEEVAKLAEARDAIDLNSPDAEALEQLFSAAHDLKGQADTLGYPFVGQICASLCKLLEYCPKSTAIPPVLINQHVDSVRAIVREEATGAEHPTASAISDKLHDVVNHFLESSKDTKS